VVAVTMYFVVCECEAPGTYRGQSSFDANLSYWRFTFLAVFGDGLKRLAFPDA
jgi:hypothetical protein